MTGPYEALAAWLVANGEPQDQIAGAVMIRRGQARGRAKQRRRRLLAVALTIWTHTNRKGPPSYIRYEGGSGAVNGDREWGLIEALGYPRHPNPLTQAWA